MISFRKGSAHLLFTRVRKIVYFNVSSYMSFIDKPMISTFLYLLNSLFMVWYFFCNTSGLYISELRFTSAMTAVLSMLFRAIRSISLLKYSNDAIL